MSALQMFFAALGAALTVLGLICAYALPAWRAERKAQAAERAAVAAFMSEQVQAGLKVLVGDPGNPNQGIPATPGLGRRMADLEEQMQPNGGGSMRDVLDQVHVAAVSNARANARVEEQLSTVAMIAGDAAAAAATADQRVRELNESQLARHAENTVRLERLERAAGEEATRRQFYLATLRELYGIELDDPEGDS